MKSFPVIAAILIVISFLLIISCASLKDTEAPFAKASGKTLKIALKANPTTGYQWAVEAEGAGYEKEDVHFNAERTNRVGAGGIWEGVFSNFQEGETILTLSYKRSWEENSTIEQRIYTVTADKEGRILSLEEETKTF